MITLDYSIPPRFLQLQKFPTFFLLMEDCVLSMSNAMLQVSLIVDNGERIKASINRDLNVQQLSAYLSVPIHFIWL